jgi:hypothetical protein
VKADFSSKLSGNRTDMPMRETKIKDVPTKIGAIHFERPLIEGDFEVRVQKWNSWL